MMKVRTILQRGLMLAGLLSLSLIVAGSLQTPAYAQNGNMQAQGNNNKVTKKKPYAIILPDLTIESARVEGSDDRRLGVLIANKGTAASKACNLKIFYHRSGAVMVRGAVVSPIAKGENLWVVIDIGSPMANASKITARVDDPNRVRESNEGNNSFIYK